MVSQILIPFSVLLFSVPKSDRTTVHKNLIVALAVAQLLLMISDRASANNVCLECLDLETTITLKSMYVE